MKNTRCGVYDINRSTPEGYLLLGALARLCVLDRRVGGMKQQLELCRRAADLQSTDILNVPIADVGFSLRTFNVLKRAGIETIGGLVKYTEDELLHIRNLGRATLCEIKGVLSHFGLCLTEDIFT